MSVYANAIDAFITIIEAKEDLIINGGLLSDLIKFGDELPEKNEEILAKILHWLKAYESRNELFKAYLNELKAQPGTIDLYEKIQMFGHEDEDEDEKEKLNSQKRRKPMLQNSIANIGNRTAEKTHNPDQKQS